MAQERVERRLAAIVATDMVGYSRLIGVDEAGTIARQKAHRAELIDPKITEYNGRIVKTTGDGLLIEFASAVDAVLCAVAVQRAMAEREAEVTEDSRIVYRVGINLGEIVIDGEDILGDGVNVAARLEALAEPGGIRISEAVFKNVKGKLDLGFADLGAEKLKNIAEPVPSYRVLLDAGDVGKVIAAKRTLPTRWRWVAGVTAAVLLLVVAGIAWWQPWAPAIARVSPGDMDHALPKKPSIAVLLFENVSGDAKQDHIAKGLTAYVIATLSKASGMFVIAQESIFAFAGKPATEQEVAKKLGVRYVLKGTVSRTGKRVRVTVRLADVVDGRILWSEIYDRKLDDLLTVQEAITKEIFAAMQVTLLRGEQARIWKLSCPKLNAYLLYMQALESMWRFTRADNARARALAERAFRLDDKCVAAVILTAWTHQFDARAGYTKTPAKSMRLARQYAEEAKRIDAENPDIHPIFCGLELSARRHGQALAHCRKAIDLTPGHSLNHAIYAWALGFSGKPREAIKIMRKAMRLSPRYPSWYLQFLAISQNLVGEREAALDTVRAATRRKDNRGSFAHVILAWVLIELGRTDEAKAAMTEALKRRSRLSARVLAGVLLFKDPKDLKRFLTATRKAGLPE